ncbi:unnamed protein product [Nezara viridula]|uniref:FAD/NAD(P)-binding domain-containing protein n=1 Tax=Nezara viridula TaxID=85310 RepID=A0A9P0H4G6_NEZVI|nr:unnamed protein product [Nezara viridula]
MNEGSTPTNLESQTITDEESTNSGNTESEIDNFYTEETEITDEEYTNSGDTESEIDNFYTEEKEIIDEEYTNSGDTESEIESFYTEEIESLENLKIGEELQSSYSENHSEESRPNSTLPLVIKVSGILNTDPWSPVFTKQRTAIKPTSLSVWRAGFIRHIGTLISVKSFKKPDAEKPRDDQEKKDFKPSLIYIGAKPIKPKVPKFITSVKNRMSIFRGKPLAKCLGKLFINLHDKLIMARRKQEEIHQSFLDERLARSIKERKLILDQARKDALIVNTEGKLFGRDLLAIEDLPATPWTARIEIRILNKHVVQSPLEAQALFDKIPVELFVRKVVEEHGTVVFSNTTCVVCLKLVTLLRNSDIKHVNLRLDKMGVYGDRINEYVQGEYSHNLPANVYYHGLHPDFVRKCYSVIETNDSDAMIGLFPDTYDLIVVGGTSLGLQTVFESRLLGVKVCLVDSPLRPAASRPITFLGKSTLSEPNVSKKILYYLLSLRNRARKHHIGDYSIDSMKRIHSDWTRLSSSARKLIAKLSSNNMSSLYNVGAGFLKCGLKFVDRHTVEITNSESEKYTLRSSYFIMANPMQHKIPNIPGSQYCFTPDQIFSLPNSPGKTLIYGATRSAVEYAGLLGSMGFPVTIMAPTKIMEECDGDMVKCIKDNMKYYGIRIIDECVLSTIKLVTVAGEKDNSLISGSDESLYKFKWNPLQSKARKKKKRMKQPRRRGRYRMVRQCELNKVIEQALLTWEVSPKVLKAIVEAGPTMRQLKEENERNKFDSVAYKKKITAIKKQKNAIRKLFRTGGAGNKSFRRIKQLHSRTGQVRRKRRLRVAEMHAKEGQRKVSRKRRRRKSLSWKFLNLFLASSPDERKLASINIRNKKPPLLKKPIRYGPHYSYNPKSRVGVYFPGGTALRLSRKGKYFKHLTPITPSKFKRRKPWSSSLCKPVNDFMNSLENLQDTDGKGYNFDDLSSEEIKDKRADNIIQEYNKEKFEIIDIFKSKVILVDVNGDTTYNLDDKHFKEYMVLSLKNIDKTLKKMLMICRNIEFKSQCLTIIRFLAKIIQILRMFHLYINWKLRNRKKFYKKSRKNHRKRRDAEQILNDTLAVEMKYKMIQNNMFNVAKNLDTLMSYIFVSACNVIAEGSNECTESEDVSNRDSSWEEHSKNASLFGSGTTPDRKSYRHKDPNLSFNSRRFYNKQRFIRTCMGSKVDIVDPYLSNKDSRLYIDDNYVSPFSFGSGRPANSPKYDINPELQKLISRFKKSRKGKKIRKIRPVPNIESSLNILRLLKEQNDNLQKKEMMPLSIESEVVSDARERNSLPDRKKIENLRIQGVRSELHFTEFPSFGGNQMVSNIIDVSINSVTLHKTKFSIKYDKLKPVRGMRTRNQIIIKQIIDENNSKSSQNSRENKTKLNFRNFVAMNFGTQYKMSSSLSQRDNYLSTLVIRSEAKAKKFKPLKWGSLAMYQKKVYRDRNIFLQSLKANVKPRPIYYLYDYEVSDSVTERLGLSTVQPKCTNSLVSLESVQRLHPTLFNSSRMRGIGAESSDPSNEIIFEIEDDKSSNILDKILQNEPRLDNVPSTHGVMTTCKAEKASHEKYSGSKSVPKESSTGKSINLERSGPIDNSRKNITKSVLSTDYSRQKILKNTVEESKRLNDSSSFIADQYTDILKVAPPEMDRSSPVNLDSYIKGKYPVVDLRRLGTIDEFKPNLKSALNLQGSLDPFSSMLDRFESNMRLFRNKKINSQKDTTSIPSTSKV